MIPSSKIRRTCCICKKLFCCIECRKFHQKEQHPGREFNCGLCCEQKLLLQRVLDEEFFCHVVINHLPLYCCLCGDLFKESKDLESFGACKFWQIFPLQQYSFSDRKSLLATPVCPDAKKKNHSTIDGDYNGNFGTLTSPPELYRTTSTPMHVSFVGQKSSFEFKTPCVPNFSLKTPNISSAASSMKDQTDRTTDSKSNDSDTKYSTCYSNLDSNQEATPFRSLSLARGTRSTDQQQSSKSSTGLMFSVMKEQDETNYGTGNENELELVVSSNDMELTSIQGGILADTQCLEIERQKSESKRRSDSVKRVRFSDQYDSDMESNIRTSTGSFNMTENEEYFEARETLSEVRESITESRELLMARSKMIIEDTTESKKSKSIDLDNDMKNYEKEAKNDLNISKLMTNEEETIEKENEQRHKTQNNMNTNQNSGSSRVVMMVVVENNANLGTTDLGSLINSGLKKLSTITNITSTNPSGCHRRSVTSVDSYVSVSSVECVAESKATPSASSTCTDADSFFESNSTNHSGGIISSVAHAVRHAFKNFSGSTVSKSMSKDRIFSREGQFSSSSSNNPLSGLTSCFTSRPRKRSRDFRDGPSTSSSSIDIGVSYNDDRSPVAKRHRGWYKIKGREPIARMKNSQITSPRGISSETQIFSQGSLSVGDTIIPIPSRAHQYTQTDGYRPSP